MADWKTLTDETNYDLPLWRLRLILTSIGQDPKRLSDLTSFAEYITASSKNADLVSCMQVMEVASLLEAIFKFPEQTKVMLKQISNTDVWNTQIAVSLAKENPNHFDLLSLCLAMVCRLDDPVMMEKMFLKVSTMFDTLADAPKEESRPLFLSTLLLTV